MEAEREKGVRLWELPRNSCHWPLGGPLQVPEFFCGAPAQLGERYCTEHHLRAFVRPNRVRREKRASSRG